MAVILKRFLSVSVTCFKKVQATNLKGKKKSSQEWLQRQLADPYVVKAHQLNYRSAFKLIEIDDRYRVFKPGQVVLDCGAAPGSWSQVAQERTLPNGTVIAIDRLQFSPIEGVHIIANQDFTKSGDVLKQLLGECKLDLVLSDMAPNATGIKMLDAENLIALAYAVLSFAVTMSNVNAAILIKVWQCEETKKLEQDLERFYHSVKFVKPNSSRSDSSEIFLLGKQFKGITNKP